jgi:hypothetical protein
MRQTVIVHFGARSEFDIPVTGPTLAPDEARRWLDEQFVENECEPLRASGKVLTADKVLALADEVGPLRFANDPAFREAFAAATAAALAKPVVRVDLAARTLSY